MPTEIIDVDIVRQGGFNFLRTGGQLAAGTAVDDMDLLSAKSQGGAGAIDSHVAAADDRYLLADVDLLAETDIPQEGRSVVDAGEILTLHPEGLAAVCPGGQENGTKALREKTINGINFGIKFYFHPGIFNHLDLLVEDLGGKAVVRDADTHHAAGFRELLENGHRMAGLGQVKAGGQTGRPG